MVKINGGHVAIVVLLIGILDMSPYLLVKLKFVDLTYVIEIDELIHIDRKF